MLDKKLELEFKKELYDLTLTESSSRADKYHGEQKAVKAIALSDMIDYSYPKSLWMDNKPEKKRKKKKVVVHKKVKEVKKEKELSFKCLSDKNDFLDDSTTRRHGLPECVCGEKVNWDEIDVREPIDIDIDSIEEIAYNDINSLSAIEEKVECLKKFGVYFLRNEKCKFMSDEFVRELNKSLINNYTIIINKEDIRLKRILDSRGYNNYIIINGRDIDDNTINLSKEEVLKNINTFVLDLQSINEELKETKLLLKKFGKKGTFLVTQEMFNNWEA